MERNKDIFGLQRVYILISFHKQNLSIMNRILSLVRKHWR
jgi:hypothetical protein